MTPYQEKVITALLQIQTNALPAEAQCISVDLKTDNLQQITEAVQFILKKYPTESLEAIFSAFPEERQSATQNADNINNEANVIPDLTANMFLQMQQELIDLRSEFNERLTALESKLYTTLKEKTRPSIDERAITKQQIEELLQQKEELQGKNRELEREIGNLYDTVTFATVDRAEIAISNQPRIDELGRRFTSLYGQEVRDLQRTWDEFLTANDPTWDSKESSIKLKTAIRFALAHMMQQYGSDIKVKQLSVRLDEVCQTIKSLPTDPHVVEHAHIMLLEQLDSMGKARYAASFLDNAPPTKDTLNEDADDTVQVIQNVLHNLSKDELAQKETVEPLISSMKQIIVTVKEVVRQIYSIGGELWLAQEGAIFDETQHERSKSSADEGVISQTEWPGYRVVQKLIKPAIVITEPIPTLVDAAIKSSESTLPL